MSRSFWKYLFSKTSTTSSRSQLIHGAMSVGSLKLASLVLTFSTAIILARGLGPNGYGQYSFIMSIITTLIIPVGTGFGEFVTREISRLHLNNDWSYYRGLILRCKQWALLSTVLVTIATMLLSFTFRTDNNDLWKLLFIASISIPLLGLNALRSGILRGLRNVFSAQLPELFIRPGFHLLIVLFLLYSNQLTIFTTILSQLTAVLFAFLVGLYLIHIYSPSKLSKDTEIKTDSNWYKAILPFTLLSAVSIFNNQIGVLILGWLGTHEDVAALQVAQSGSLLVALSLTIVNMIIAPHIARAFRNGNKAYLQTLSRNSARIAFIFSLPIALPLLFASGDIIDIVYGKEYVDIAKWPLTILAFGQLVNVAFGSVGLYLIMAGHEKDTLFGQIIALIVSTLLTILLVPHFGAIGAAISAFTGLITWNLLLAYKFATRLGLKPTCI